MLADVQCAGRGKDTSTRRARPNRVGAQLAKCRRGDGKRGNTCTQSWHAMMPPSGWASCALRCWSRSALR